MRLLPPSARIALLTCTALSLPLIGFAQSSPASTGNVTVSVEQSGPVPGAAGVWTILTPDHRRVEMEKKISHTFNSAPSGQYTVIATPPSGASASIEIFSGDQKLESTDLPQISFAASDGDVIRVHITFTYTSVGKVSVNSTPPGLTFVMRGPDERTYTDTTPAEYLDAPIGLYSLTFDPIRDCAEPKAQSDQLTKNGRIAFSIDIVCDRIDLLPQTRSEERSLEFVTVSIGEDRVTFTDVPLDTWFATFVNTAIRTGIMSGYKNAEGGFSGLFGPGDSVTVAQLAKVAHKLAHIDEHDSRSLPENLRARDTWFSDFFASAERLHWMAFRNPREDPERAASRSEVVCTLLQALNIPRIWPTGMRFTDVSATAPYADCIETAAEDGLVEGDSATGTFGPDRPVNRAELSKMLVSAMEIYGEKTAEIRGNYDGVK